MGGRALETSESLPTSSASERPEESGRVEEVSDWGRRRSAEETRGKKDSAVSPSVWTVAKNRCPSGHSPRSLDARPRPLKVAPEFGSELHSAASSALGALDGDDLFLPPLAGSDARPRPKERRREDRWNERRAGRSLERVRPSPFDRKKNSLSARCVHERAAPDPRDGQPPSSIATAKAKGRRESKRRRGGSARGNWKGGRPRLASSERSLASNVAPRDLDTTVRSPAAAAAAAAATEVLVLPASRTWRAWGAEWRARGVLDRRKERRRFATPNTAAASFGAIALPAGNCGAWGRGEGARRGLPRESRLALSRREGAIPAAGPRARASEGPAPPPRLPSLLGPEERIRPVPGKVAGYSVPALFPKVRGVGVGRCAKDG
ncbi:hypothetical protein KM043_001607 [Ampulex compressa]|nr:hypothetical protein KM043_001607 [Ampulex compressa]